MKSETIDILMISLRCSNKPLVGSDFERIKWLASPTRVLKARGWSNVLWFS